jgi:dihydroorotate dehydrogenase
MFLKSSSERSEEEIREIMSLIRKYHKSLDINLSSIKEGKLDGIIVINTTDLKIKILNQEEFLKLKKFYNDIEK